MTQERMTGADVYKVDANSKADASDASNINIPKIDAKRGIPNLDLMNDSNGCS